MCNLSLSRSWQLLKETYYRWGKQNKSSFRPGTVHPSSLCDGKTKIRGCRCENSGTALKCLGPHLPIITFAILCSPGMTSIWSLSAHIHRWRGRGETVSHPEAVGGRQRPVMVWVAGAVRERKWGPAGSHHGGENSERCLEGGDRVPGDSPGCRDCWVLPGSHGNSAPGEGNATLLGWTDRSSLGRPRGRGERGGFSGTWQGWNRLNPHWQVDS